MHVSADHLSLHQIFLTQTEERNLRDTKIKKRPKHDGTFTKFVLLRSLFYDDRSKTNIVKCQRDVFIHLTKERKRKEMFLLSVPPKSLEVEEEESLGPTGVI